MARENETAEEGRAILFVRADNDAMLPGTTLFSGVRDRSLGLTAPRSRSSASLHNCSSLLFFAFTLDASSLVAPRATALNADKELAAK